MRETERRSWGEASLIRGSGPLWQEATRSRFLDGLAEGSLPESAFHGWLSQDYLFAKGLTTFQAIVLSKAPRDCHNRLISGLTALDSEMDWFERQSRQRGIELDAPPHPICRSYIDFLVRSAYGEPYPVLLAILFGVEVSYLGAWSALEAKGPYAEFIERWSNPAFVEYVSALGALAERYPHEGAQRAFDAVLQHERDFWKMTWES